MTIVWMDAARDDLHHWLDYMAPRNPYAGKRMARDVLEAIDTLKDNPLRGRVGKLHKTRELILPNSPLKVIYTAEQDLITILFIPHQRQRWPKS